MLGSKWRKSSRSGANGACVEARLFDEGVEVRDSKDVTGPTLSASANDWTDVLAITRQRGR